MDKWTNAEIVKIRSSWTDVVAANYYKDCDFVDTIFSELMVENVEARTLLEDPQVFREQKELFAMILKNTMLYLHKKALLDECMSEFISENPSVVVYGVTYLEPLGTVLIKALRRSLGSDRFHTDLEGLWVKLFIYIANSILLNDDACSESEEEKSITEPVAPLRLPSVYNTPTKNDFVGPDMSRLTIDLDKNEKYRGFRRNSLALEGPTLSLVIPPAMSPAKSSYREYEVEPHLTPRSSRRNTEHMMEKLGLLSENLSGSKASRQAAPFDPRRKPSHRRSLSDATLSISTPDGPYSQRSSISTVDDISLEDEINFSSPEEPRASVFDSKSFGIAALAPIAESEPDRYGDATSTASSRYGIDDSALEASSGTSSLSLHNLDYKSSISSGSGHSDHVNNFKSSGAAVASPQPRSYGFPFLAKEYDSPYANKAYLSSVPHFGGSDQGKRASVGFMKSSYVLKKGMSSDVSDAASIAYSSRLVSKPHSYARSVFSLPPDNSPPTRENPYKFAPPPKIPSFDHKPTSKAPKVELIKKETSKPLANDRTLVASMTTETKSTRKSFLKKLHSIFGSSSAQKKTISAPIPVTSGNANASMASAGYSSRISSSEIRSKSTVLARSEMFDMSDVQSYQSNAKTSHSIFRGNTKPLAAGMDKDKRNKYFVKKVPYKTIYIKDLIHT
ncbi:hypothetical protein PUMCH_004001 [Australozyma saopauloensis]|uniref:Globin family profile domain-containing protein n=1 Tax=Australozyma saopauloensis TaxID=291208 RepID=A0AAX4HDE2_9ASCO|nr:hypothetical protein PUMCH_004001 [[Candida] saopauloensis]